MTVFCVSQVTLAILTVFLSFSQVTQASNIEAENGVSPQLSRQQLEKEIEKLKKINREFYNFAVEELLEEVRSENKKGTWFSVRDYGKKLVNPKFTDRIRLYTVGNKTMA